MSEVDLHTHSTASDGSLTPTELVARARKCGLRAMALTDHDTVSGLPEAIEAGKKYSVEVIPGCELSVEFKPGTMHIVGLWLPPHPERLLSALQYLRDQRHNRNHIIVEKLNSLGIEITYDQVLKKSRGESVGRPHIAGVLQDMGVVRSFSEAFNRFLGPDGKAYVPKTKFDPGKAISILREEGATVILAHPYSLEIGEQEFESLVRRFMDLGLEGLEVYYSVHSPEQVRYYLSVAEKFGLLVSGGSDFHGDVKPHIELGRGMGNLNIPYTLVERMKAHRAKQGLPV